MMEHMEHGASPEMMAGRPVKRRGKLGDVLKGNRPDRVDGKKGFRFPTAEELATVIDDLDLQKREPLWVATYLFTREPGIISTENRLGQLFPNLPEERITQLADSARIWWTTDGRDLFPPKSN